MSTKKWFSIILIVISAALFVFVWNIEQSHFSALNDKLLHSSKGAVMFMTLDSGCKIGEPNTWDPDKVAFNEMIKSRPCTLVNYALLGPGRWFLGIPFLLLAYIFFVLRVGSSKNVPEGAITQEQFIRAYLGILLVTLAILGTLLGLFFSAVSGWGEGSMENWIKVLVEISIFIPVIGYILFIKYGWVLLCSNRGKVTLLTFFVLPFIVYFIIFFGGYY